jgi:Helix-turn-helix domain
VSSRNGGGPLEPATVLPAVHVPSEATARDSSGEAVEVPPGSPKHFDKRLRYAAREVGRTWDLLVSAIADAKAHEIHKDLGFKSWPDYIADVASREMPNVARSVEQRRQIVTLLAGEGMSQRAIADAVGVNHATVSRDQAAIEAEEVLHDATPEPDAAELIVGLDGKSYPAKRDVPKPKPSNTFVNRFYRELSQVQHHALQLEILTKKEEFAEHIDAVVAGHREGVAWAHEIIARVLDQLHSDQVELF